MIRTLIADDEPLARAALRSLLAEEADLDVIGEAADGDVALELIKRDRPDLVFLDIKMPGLTGLEVAEGIGLEAPPALVFVTAFDRFAVKAFESRALDYILKPITIPRLRDAVQRARKAIDSSTAVERHRNVLSVLRSLAGNGPETASLDGPVYLRRIQVHVANRMLWVDIKAIDWIESERNCVRLHVGEVVHLIRKTMAELESQLDPAQFVRIHRTAIVNRVRIVEIRHEGHGEYTVMLSGGLRLKLGRTYRHRLLVDDQ